tara:strand:- start:545 stop:1204 length:660 start_codon:yes stop_codon:yes gene_type:complete
MSNAKIKTTNIKGKQYAEVHERIKHFRGEPNYASLGINTEVLEWDKDKEEIVIRATIYDTKSDNGRILASGIAHERRDDKNSFVNKTSYVENAETSAIGRALACMGIGIEDAYASAFEVANAVAQQNANDGKKKDHLKVVDPPKESEPADSIDSIPTHDSNDEIVQNLATRMHASACISYEKLQELVNSSDFQEIADQLDTKQAEEIMGYVGRLKSALM